MKPTLKDVARLAKVSTGTVDRVLHNRGRVSTETRERIERIIEDLNYQPNIFAKNLSSGQGLTIGVLMPAPVHENDYWVLSLTGIKHAKEQLKPYNVAVKIYSYDKYDPAAFKKAARSTLQDDLSGLLVARVRFEATHEFLVDLPKKLPVVFFDAKMPGTDSLSTVFQDSHNSSVMAARLMHLLVGNSGLVHVLRFLPNSYHLEQRVTGFCDYLNQKSEVQTAITDIPGPVVESYLTEIFDNWFQHPTKPSGIFVTNWHACDVARYLVANDLKDKVALIGYDLVAENIEFLKNGSIDFVISQRPEMQGYTGIWLLYRHLMFGDEIAPEIRLPIDIVTRENVDSFVADHSIGNFKHKTAILYEE